MRADNVQRSHNKTGRTDGQPEHGKRRHALMSVRRRVVVRHFPSRAPVRLLVVAVGAELVEASQALAQALQRAVEPLFRAGDVEPVAEQRLEAARVVAVGEASAAVAAPHSLRRAHRHDQRSIGTSSVDYRTGQKSAPD